MSEIVRSLLRWLVWLGFGGAGLIWMVGYAAECGKIQFLEDRSRGVEVQFDRCPGAQEVSEGAILNLAPGARLWLKLPAAEAGRGYQMVCQSRSDSALVLLIESLEPPWVGSDSLQCEPWDGSGFACDGADGKPKVLVCVAGELTGSTFEPSPRKGASIVLRSLGQAPGGLEEPSRRQAVLEAIEKEGQLCHKLYGGGRKFNVEWTVDAAGKVTEIAPEAAISKASPGFADCLTGVIRSYPYPKSSRTVFLNAAL